MVDVVQDNHEVCQKIPDEVIATCFRILGNPELTPDMTQSPLIEFLTVASYVGGRRTSHRIADQMLGGEEAARFRSLMTLESIAGNLNIKIAAVRSFHPCFTTFFTCTAADTQSTDAYLTP